MIMWKSGWCIPEVGKDKESLDHSTLVGTWSKYVRKPPHVLSATEEHTCSVPHCQNSLDNNKSQGSIVSTTVDWKIIPLPW